MARPNYGFQKRQKQLAKQKKKEAKRQRKLEDTGPSDETMVDNSEAVRLAEAVQEVKERMAELPEGSSAYALGGDLLLNLNARSVEETLELAEGFLTMVAQARQA